jgi:hypothetical protein
MRLCGIQSIGTKISDLKGSVHNDAFARVWRVGAQKELLTSDGSEEVVYVKFQNMMYLCRP